MRRGHGQEGEERSEKDTRGEERKGEEKKNTCGEERGEEEDTRELKTVR